MENEQAFLVLVKIEELIPNMVFDNHIGSLSDVELVWDIGWWLDVHTSQF